MHHVQLPPIDRRSVWYWIDGGGAWLPRGHCTSDDLWLQVFSTVACTWMVIEYLVYTVNTIRDVRHASDSYDRRHRIRLAWVFGICGPLHFVTGVLSWYCTLYWLVAFGWLGNAVMCRLLNRSKLAQMALREREANAAKLAEAQAFRAQVESILPPDPSDYLLSNSEQMIRYGNRLRELARCGLPGGAV